MRRVTSESQPRSNGSQKANHVTGSMRSANPKSLMKTLTIICAGAVSLQASTLTAQAPTPVNLYVADLTYANGTVSIGTPRKLTGDRGVNSQPSFTPDGKAILFVSRRDTTGQS